MYFCIMTCFLCIQYYNFIDCMLNPNIIFVPRSLKLLIESVIYFPNKIPLLVGAVSSHLYVSSLLIVCCYHHENC